MRVFIAIPLPESCLSMLSKMQKRLRECHADVRWTSVTSMHLTLKFLGDIDPGILTDLAGILKIAARQTDRFHLRLSGVGSFPDGKNPRILWCGILDETESLARLQANIENTCTSLGFSSEDRPFRPHLTLGRVKSRRNLKTLTASLGAGTDQECDFDVDHFNIYKSVLKPQGAVYTILETMALK
jgi:2'-5' RNA ligase